MKSRWSILALCAFFVAAAVAVSGCGSSIPSGAVANVAGSPISKGAVDHWMYILDKEQSAQSPGAAVIVPNDPPQFSKCITQARAAYPTLKKESDTQIRATCKQLFTSLSSQVMNELISGYWLQALAHHDGITITDANVQSELATEKKQNHITTEAAFQALLKQQGLSVTDIEYETRIELAIKKLEAKQPTAVSSSDISDYYTAHKSTFGSPETRSLRIVLATSEAKAKAALAALKSGKSWGVVAKKYSSDPQTKDRGGLLPDITQGEEDQALSTAAFAAPANKLEGPVHGQFGWYVLEVIKITPAKVVSLAKATPQIKSTLTSQKQQAAQTAVTSAAKKRYGAQTQCTKTYAMADCHGYKAPKTSTSASAPSTATATAPASTSSSAPSSSSTTSSTSSH